MNWNEWLAKHRAALERAPYEWRFAVTTLAEVPDLDPANVHIQTPFRDVNGRNRRIDFTISEGRYVRIAIEVDGYDKRGTGTPSRSDFHDWSVRETSMVAQGWRPMRYANSFVKHSPSQCVTLLSSVLKIERVLARELERSAELLQNVSLAEAREQITPKTQSAEDRAIIEKIQAENNAMLAQARAETTHYRQQAAQAKTEKERVHKMSVKAIAAVLVVALVVIGVIAGMAMSGSGENNSTDTRPGHTNTQPIGTNCDAAYPGVCIAPPPPDLDCKDIPHRRFRVVQPDPHRFDPDRDGSGCELG